MDLFTARLIPEPNFPPEIKAAKMYRKWKESAEASGNETSDEAWSIFFHAYEKQNKESQEAEKRQMARVESGLMRRESAEQARQDKERTERESILDAWAKLFLSSPTKTVYAVYEDCHECPRLLGCFDCKDVAESAASVYPKGKGLSEFDIYVEEITFCTS